MPGDGARIVEFDPDYAATQTVFSLTCTSESCSLLRSRDGGKTQQSVLPLPPYSYPLTLLAPDLGWGSTGAGAHEVYLYASGYPAPQLLRSLDRGDTWQAADSSALQGVTSIALAPDGRLWFGSKGSVRSVEPGALSWSPVS